MKRVDLFLSGALFSGFLPFLPFQWVNFHLTPLFGIICLSLSSKLSRNKNLLPSYLSAHSNKMDSENLHCFPSIACLFRNPAISYAFFVLVLLFLSLTITWARRLQTGFLEVFVGCSLCLQWMFPSLFPPTWLFCFVVVISLEGLLWVELCSLKRHIEILMCGP